MYAWKILNNKNKNSERKGRVRVENFRQPQNFILALYYHYHLSVTEEHEQKNFL